jgi:hypothetical protein
MNRKAKDMQCAANAGVFVANYYEKHQPSQD